MTSSSDKTAIAAPSATPAAGQPADPVRGVAITPTDISLVARGEPSADLAAMQARFAADFAAGTMGRHHNSYQHRARILRQLADDESAT